MTDEHINNPLCSTQPSSDGLKVILHPLVLLSVSDYIARHTLRQQQGPIVGGLLGQQNGRELSLGFAFEAKLQADSNGEASLSMSWLVERVQQCT